MGKRKFSFSENEQLVIQYDITVEQLKDKNNQISIARNVIDNYEQIETDKPKEAWEALLIQLKIERTAIEKRLGEISSQMDKKRIDTSSSKYSSAKQTATHQPTLSPFFKKPVMIEYDTSASTTRLDLN